MKAPRQRFWTYFPTVLIVAGVLWIWLTSTYFHDTTGEDNIALYPGFLAPDFSATTMSGEETRLSDWRGQAVLINLWASWCVPCRTEMPALERVFQDYQPDGLVILAVNATDQDDEERVRSFAEELDLTFPILLDRNGDISRSYHLTALPTSYFIAPDGRIQEIVVGGPMSEALLRSRVEKLLQKREGKAP
jgi:cytochrome c biogenesis protein CcmG/thiol:disulfide interchange protein DsbE